MHGGAKRRLAPNSIHEDQFRNSCVSASDELALRFHPVVMLVCAMSLMAVCTAWMSWFMPRMLSRISYLVKRGGEQRDAADLDLDRVDAA
jgi:hypothetical protein